MPIYAYRCRNDGKGVYGVQLKVSIVEPGFASLRQSVDDLELCSQDLTTRSGQVPVQSNFS